MINFRIQKIIFNYYFWSYLQHITINQSPKSLKSFIEASLNLNWLLLESFLLLNISNNGSFEKAATSGISVYPKVLYRKPDVIGTSSKKLKDA